MNRTASSCPLFLAFAGLAAVALPAAASETKSPETVISAEGNTRVETMVAARDVYQALAGHHKPKNPGPKAFSSDLLRGDTPAQHISIDVSGANYLRLLTTLEESPGNCHVWGDAQLIGKDGRQTPLGSLRPLSSRVGWGQLYLDENWQKQSLQIGPKKFQHGLWVHADSDLCYALDGKYQRFEAWIGLTRPGPAAPPGSAWRFDGPRSRPKAGDLPQEVRDFRHAMLLGLRGMKEFLAESPLVDLEKEWDCQYRALEHDLQNRGRFARFAPETYRAQSLLAAEDRDPADIVLRRTAALLTDLKRTSAAATLAALEKELAELQAANGRIKPEDGDARYVLFADACRLRRQIAARNPLLNFDQMLFVKHHRSTYNHMCDQYYGSHGSGPAAGCSCCRIRWPPRPRCATSWPARPWPTAGSRA